MTHRPRDGGRREHERQPSPLGHLVGDEVARLGAKFLLFVDDDESEVPEFAVGECVGSQRRSVLSRLRPVSVYLFFGFLLLGQYQCHVGVARGAWGAAQDAVEFRVLLLGQCRRGAHERRL